MSASRVRRRTRFWPLPLLLSIALALGGCASRGGALLWQSGLDYVRLEPQQVPPAQARPNDHPARFTPAQVRALLGALEIEARPTAIGRLLGLDREIEYEPLFAESELHRIAPLIAKALAMASPYQDVTVSTTAPHRGGFIDYVDESKTTTARLFYRDGRLNMIFSVMQFPLRRKIALSGRTDPKGPNYVSEIDMHRARPHAGRRDAPAKIDRVFRARPWLTFAKVGGRLRADWLVIDPRPILAAAESEKRTRAGARARAEQAALQRKVDRLERELRSRRLGPAAPAGAGDSEARLARLKRLYKQGVISRELYLEKAGALLGAC